MRRTFLEIFLMVFPSTALLFGAMLYLLMHLYSFGLPGLAMAMGLGIGCGIIFGVGIGYFARGDELLFQIDPVVDMHTRLQLVLIDMGYRLDSQYQKVIMFKPTARAGLFADRIRVELRTGEMLVEGPCYHLEKMRRALGV